MINLNTSIFESALLFILVTHIFRSEQISDQLIILLTATLVMFFLLTPFFRSKSLKPDKISLLSVISIAVIIYGFLLTREVTNRRVEIGSVHDGVIVTEASYRALLSGANPYSVNFGDSLNREKYSGNIPFNATINYPYSPVMFLANTPIFYATDKLIGVVDMRITLVIFLFLAALIGVLMIQEKILFLIIFLFNPLFMPLLFYGANDILVLFFFFLQLYFLSFKKFSSSTIMLALAGGTKILILPLVPLYFLYLFMLSDRASRSRFLFRQFLLFILVNLIVYIPFLIGSGRDLLDDLVFSWIGSGAGSHPIAGFLGLPQILASLGLIPVDSPFPFFLFALPLEAVFLIFAFYVFKRSRQLSTLCVLLALNLIAVLTLSRLVQTYYLAFLSQILVLASFLDFGHGKRGEILKVFKLPK